MTADQAVVVGAVSAVVLLLGAAATVLTQKRGQVAAQRSRDQDRQTLQDLYTVAASRLIDADPAMRLAALGMLEDLAQEHPAYRRAVLEVWCAYLRRATNPASTQSGDHVRTAIQHRLSAHLVASAGAQIWPGASLRLDAATLHDLDLTGADLVALSCRRARLSGTTRLTGARVRGPADLTGARFTGPCHADDVDFDGRLTATGASFDDRVSFTSCVVRGDASFGATQFRGPADFSAAVFLGLTLFTEPLPARFHTAVSFRGAAMSRARFDHVEFAHPADFTDARFARDPHLAETEH